MRFVACTLVIAFAAAAPHGALAESRWIKARLGPFEAISDEGRRPATQALNQFAQFSFALGTAMGQPDLRLDPALRIIVFKNQQELAAQCTSGPGASGLMQGRERLMACTTPEGRLPAPLLRELTRVMLENNFSRMPAPIEAAIETFFSTIQATGVHVTWGDPPPAPERTREWALLHRILTQPELSGRAKIYLHNLAAGMDRAAASRNAFGEEGASFDADSERYFAAGVFHSSVAPNRPLDPDRDFNTTELTSDEGQLMHADLLNAASPAIYQGLIKAGKQLAPSYEGLAMLALRADNVAKAGQLIDAARDAGTKNFVVLTAYAEREPDAEKAGVVLREALTADPKYALAHWVYGEKLADPRRRMGEWKQATDLAPRNYEWLAQYAKLCLAQQQYAEAGRAWSSAAQSAPTDALRDEYLGERAKIETQRLEAEDAERRRVAEEKAREIERLKAEARNEIARIEAQANANPLSKQEAAKVVDYADTDTSDARVLSGMLTRVECTSTTKLRLTVKDTQGKLQTLLVPDTREFEIRLGDQSGQTLACGAQAKPGRVNISYRPAKADSAGGAGRATGQAKGAATQKDAVPGQAPLGQALTLELLP